MNFERPLTDSELDALRPLVKKRGERVPIAYLVGKKEFWSMDFFCAPGVLIPRPDTETLVETAKEFLKDDGDTFLADVGAGTGILSFFAA